MFSGVPSSSAPWAWAATGAASMPSAARAEATRIRIPPRVTKPSRWSCRGRTAVKSPWTPGRDLSVPGARRIALGRAHDDVLAFDQIANLHNTLCHPGEREIAVVLGQPLG